MNPEDEKPAPAPTMPTDEEVDALRDLYNDNSAMDD